MDKIKKLKLNKEVIANLNKVEMNQIKGGIYDGLYTHVNCFTNTPACNEGGGDTYSCPPMCGGSGGHASITCPPPPPQTAANCGGNQTSGCVPSTWDGCEYTKDYCGSESQGCMYTDPYW